MFVEKSHVPAGVEVEFWRCDAEKCQDFERLPFRETFSRFDHMCLVNHREFHKFILMAQLAHGP